MGKNLSYNPNGHHRAEVDQILLGPKRDHLGLISAVSHPSLLGFRVLRGITSHVSLHSCVISQTYGKGL